MSCSQLQHSRGILKLDGRIVALFWTLLVWKRLWQLNTKFNILVLQFVRRGSSTYYVSYSFSSQWMLIVNVAQVTTQFSEWYRHICRATTSHSLSGNIHNFWIQYGVLTCFRWHKKTPATKIYIWWQKSSILALLDKNHSIYWTSKWCHLTHLFERAILLTRLDWRTMYAGVCFHNDRLQCIHPSRLPTLMVMTNIDVSSPPY